VREKKVSERESERERFITEREREREKAIFSLRNTLTNLFPYFFTK